MTITRLFVTVSTKSWPRTTTGWTAYATVEKRAGKRASERMSFPVLAIDTYLRGQSGITLESGGHGRKLGGFNQRTDSIASGCCNGDWGTSVVYTIAGQCRGYELD